MSAALFASGLSSAGWFSSVRRFSHVAQNLNLSWEFIMANIDNDLRAAILVEVSECMDINPDLAQSGPMAFFIIANRIIRASDALAHNVVTGIMGCRDTG